MLDNQVAAGKLFSTYSVLTTKQATTIADPEHKSATGFRANRQPCMDYSVRENLTANALQLIVLEPVQKLNLEKVTYEV